MHGDDGNMMQSGYKLLYLTNTYMYALYMEK